MVSRYILKHCLRPRAVVGVDSLIKVMERVVGGNMHSARREVLRMLMSRTGAGFPMSPIGECGLQSLRKSSGGINAMCRGQCTTFFELSAVGACLP